MFYCREKHYPMITLESLSGFTEDKGAATRFARLFWPLSLSCITAFLCFGACILIPLFRGQTDPVPQIYMALAAASFAVVVVLFIITWRRMISYIPVSRQTLKPMEVFQLQDTIKEGRYGTGSIYALTKSDIFPSCVQVAGRLMFHRKLLILIVIIYYH